MRYTPDRRGTREDVLRAPGTMALIRQRAERGKAAAQASAASFRETGEYMRSITVRERTRLSDRYGVILTATAPYAQRIEQRYHTIASVVDVIERG